MSDVTEADLCKHIEAVYAEAAQANEQDTWTAPRVRKALAERGVEVDDELWKSKWKAVAKTTWLSLLVSSPWAPQESSTG